MIEIMNLRNTKPSKLYDVRVDRTSVLGNPYKIQFGTTRDEVCDRYDKRFNRIISAWAKSEGEVVSVEQREMHNALQKLVLLYEEYGKLRLFCWCTPKRCHVETIRNYILFVERNREV